MWFAAFDSLSTYLHATSGGLSLMEGRKGHNSVLLF